MIYINSTYRAKKTYIHVVKNFNRQVDKKNKKVGRKIKKGIDKKKFSLYNRHTNEPFTTNVGD